SSHTEWTSSVYPIDSTLLLWFFFSSRRRHTRSKRDWSSDVALPIYFKLTVTSPGDIIWIYFTIAGLVAIVATLPVLSLQLWLFVKPGLTEKERKVSLSYIPAVFLLF